MGSVYIGALEYIRKGAYWRMSYRIKFLWDDEAAVWVATSQDVPGLVLESGSFDALIERVQVAAQELIALNNLPTSNEFCYHTEMFRRAYA